MNKYVLGSESTGAVAPLELGRRSPLRSREMLAPVTLASGAMAPR